MTKERRLAVQMWREIAECIRSGNIKFISDIVNYKRDFCVRHCLDWPFNCYMCKYHKQNFMNGSRKPFGCFGCLLYERCGFVNCSERGNPYSELKEVDFYFSRKPYTQ